MIDKIFQFIQTAMLAVPGKRMKTKLIVLILTELFLVIVLYIAISHSGGMSDERWIRFGF